MTDAHTQHELTSRKLYWLGKADPRVMCCMILYVQHSPTDEVTDMANRLATTGAVEVLSRNKGEQERCREESNPLGTDGFSGGIPTGHVLQLHSTLH